MTEGSGEQPIFTIEMLPAGPGDCLWIEYGDPGSPYRILVDGGVPGTTEALTARMRTAGGNPRFELLVVTHVDDDHIGGVLGWLENVPAQPDLGEIWFNGQFDRGTIGSEDFEQGDRLTRLLAGHGPRWNGLFSGRAVCVEDGAEPPEFEIAGGMVVTVLSPRRCEVDALREKWLAEVRGTLLSPDASPASETKTDLEERPPCPPIVDVLALDRLASTTIKADPSVSNASSIVIALEYAGKRVILGGDARSKVIEDTIGRWQRDRVEGRLQVDALKLAHHGSRNNTSVALLQALDCRRYLVSTDGSHHCHPNDTTIARIAKAAVAPEIVFSTRNHRNEVWWSRELVDGWGYVPATASGPVDLLATIPEPD